MTPTEILIANVILGLVALDEEQLVDTAKKRIGEGDFAAHIAYLSQQGGSVAAAGFDLLRQGILLLLFQMIQY